MEAKRNNEALFALEFIKNVKDELFLDKHELGKIIDIAVDMIFDKPKANEEETPELLLGTYEYPMEVEE